MTLWALSPRDADWAEPHPVTHAVSPTHLWTLLSFDPPETVAWPFPTSTFKAICHALIEDLPPAAFPELLRMLNELDGYYSLPVSVTPSSHLRRAETHSRERRKPPVFDLTER